MTVNEMKTIKIIGADWELVASPKREENEEKSYQNWTGKGVPVLCGCCGKIIKDTSKAKSLHLIEGGSYFTEDEREFDDGSDMGGWYVGPTCYKKYLKNRKEIEITKE